MIFAWTEERLSLLTKRWAEGYSSRQIGRELGTSHNSVIGKVRRLSLPFRDPGKSERQKGRPRHASIDTINKRPLPHRNGGAALNALKAMVNRPKIELPPLSQTDKETLLGKGLSIMELKFDSCHWIITDLPRWGKHLYCGEKQVKGLSYCACHARMAYRAGKAEAEAEAA